MIRLLDSTSESSASLPSLELGEAHAIVAHTKERAIDLVKTITKQLPSAIIAPWQSDDTLATVNATIATPKYAKNYHSVRFARALKNVVHGLKVIVYIVDNALPQTANLQPITDGTLSNYARTTETLVVIILVGFDRNWCRKTLIKPATGLTSVQLVDATREEKWDIVYWFKHGAVLQNVLRTTTEESLEPQKSEMRKLGKNAPKYALAGACESHEKLPKGWREIEHYNTLSDYLEYNVDGTLLLPANRYVEIATLVETIYRVRKQAGNAWKIIVRERDAVIRSFEEKVLLDAGATLILPRELPFNRLINLTESLSGWTYQGVPPDLKTLQSHLSMTATKGLVPASTFFRLVPSLSLQTYQGGNDFTLLFAHLAKGVSMQDLFSRLDVHRPGDLITHTTDGVYIFLPACRPADVDKVLVSMFHMPVSHLFTHEERVHSLRSIELICERALRAAELLQTPLVEVNNPQTSEVPSDNEHFYPKTKAARLHSES